MPPATSTAAGCRSGAPLANVYHPDRLSILKPCMTVSGTVTDDRAENDGDSHIHLALDAPYATLRRVPVGVLMVLDPIVVGMTHLTRWVLDPDDG